MPVTCRQSVSTLPFVACLRCDLAQLTHTFFVAKGVAERLAEAKAVQRVKEERKQKRASSSSSTATGSTASKNGFPFASTSSRDTTTTTTSLDALVKGRTGSTRLSEKGKTIPIGSKNHAKSDPSANGERTTSSRSKEGTEESSGGPAMSRPSTSASTSKSKPQPDRATPKKPTREGSEEEDDLEITGGPQKRIRHKDGTVMEELVSGPKEFDAPADDPDWSRYEPYSGIHLKCVIHAIASTCSGLCSS